MGLVLMVSDASVLDYCGREDVALGAPYSVTAWKLEDYLRTSGGLSLSPLIPLGF